MKAMIFAAGLGTRLKPLTDQTPKALIPVGGVPMLEHVILKLKSSGFDEVIINIHHHPHQIRDFLKSRNNFNISISLSDESAQLLDTGGGLKKAEWFFNDSQPFLVHNADILSDIDLKKIYDGHPGNNALATLVVQKRKTERLLLFDGNMDLVGWKNALTGTIRMPVKKEVQHEYAFCGIHIINPELLKLVHREGVFSIIDTYLEIIKDHPIKGIEIKNTFWIDIGNHQNLEEAEKYIKGI
jgi:NDP-sugar pyrophosphorylase family protein